MAETTALDGADLAPANARSQKEGPTLSSLVIRYVVERERDKSFSPRTGRTAHYALGYFVQVVGDRPARRLTRRHIEKWIQHKDRSPATLRAQLSLIGTFCKWMVERGYLRQDPTARIPRPRQPRYLPRGLQQPQVATAIQQCPDLRAKLILSFMVQEGLRCCEVAGLQVGDLDFGDRSVRIVQAKGGHQRVLPVTSETWGFVERYLDESPASAGPLIRSYRVPTRGISPDHVSVLVGRWLSGAGVNATAHALRHTAAGDVLRAGAHLRDVQAMLGHASLKSTERYLPLLVGDLREAMDGRSYREPVT